VSQKQPLVVIIKKTAHGKHGHHGGAWKVAYADFVTAMMAFFMVMWLVNSNPQVKSSVATYFRDPGVFETTSGLGVLPGATAGVAPGDAPLSEVAASRAALEGAARQIREAMEKLPNFEEIKDRIQIELTPEGLRIELSDTDESSFFRIGSSEVQPETVDLLRIITAHLIPLPNPMTIEGHTDARPYDPMGGYSNWELSTARANSARRVMMNDAGLPSSRLHALTGYGDARLRFADKPLDAGNRRVALLVLAQPVPVAEPPQASKPAPAANDHPEPTPGAANASPEAPAAPVAPADSHQP
jgi:chemotaxis protein MotB